MMRRAVIAAVVAVAVAAGVAVGAQGPGGPGPRGPRGGPLGGGPGGPLPVDILRGLDLSDAQREQVRSIADGQREALQQIATRLREAHQGLRAAVEADTVDEAAIRSASGNVAAAMADEAVLRARIRTQVFEVLTAEQQQTVKERRDKMAARAAEPRPTRRKPGR